MLLIGISTIVLTIILCVFALGKFVAPTSRARDAVRRLLSRLVEIWIGINNFVLSLFRRPRWDIEIPADLDRDGSYVVACNHQSWVDILVLQRCFNRRLPLLAFFIKSVLIWVPFLGLAWWALDFPFMRRVSKEQLARNPHLKGRDLENARKACEKFRNTPVAMMSFPEGTRFSPAKRERQSSPYRHLLRPRTGGIGQVLYALGDKLDALVDVTIIYPETMRSGESPTFWELVSGQLPEIVVRAEKRAIPASLLGRNFTTDSNARRELQAWINGLWEEKDQLISTLATEHAQADQGA